MAGEYAKVSIGVSDWNLVETGVLPQALVDVGFESTVESDGVLEAYCARGAYSPEGLEGVLASFEGLNLLEEVGIDGQNWNAAWEASVQPIRIARNGVTVLVRASFHTDCEPATHEIVIDPKMAFGTGHHATTAQVAELMLGLDLEGCECLDMGCGTGLLAILADRLGAKSVDALDIDPWSFESTEENCATNGAQGVRPLLGGFDDIPQGARYDYIFANMTRNLLVDNMDVLSGHLKPGGALLVSGFYSQDLEDIHDAAGAVGLSAGESVVRNDWVAAQLLKTS
ncbi:MAG: 50S ribosomal protein L11 methyltransferase [Bacteroidetes bacterium]|nr:MAG: 50S ribosomal protein L11 methyltransferase [Bacteroidota bacterium]